MAAITASEWIPMRIIWSLKQAHTGTVISYVQQQTDWSDSTVKTLLRRLQQKGFVQTKHDGRRLVYKPVYGEEATMKQTADAQFASMCAHHRGQVLIHLVKNNLLSKSDLLALQKIIADKLPTAPASVACNCLKGGKKHEC